MAESGTLSDHQHARADLIRAQLAYVTGRGSDAPPCCSRQPNDSSRSTPRCPVRPTCEALQAAIFAGRLALGGGVMDVARAAKVSPRPTSPHPHGPAARRPLRILHRRIRRRRCRYCAAPSAPRAATCPTEERHFLWLAGIAALHVWDDESWDVVSARHLELARAAGALAELPLALSSRAVMLTFSGELAAAEALLHELKTVTEATGDSLATDPAMSLAAFRGSSGRGIGDDRIHDQGRHGAR